MRFFENDKSLENDCFYNVIFFENEKLVIVLKMWYFLENDKSYEKIKWLKILNL